jgi:translation initiation factor IF-2
VSVRIYAFAKELGLDNKQLLDICDKANIKGKGSALASLDETEVATIKEFMAGGSAEPEPAAPEAGVPIRPSAPVKKKIGEMVVPKAPEPPPEEEVVEEEVIAEELPAVAEAAEEQEQPESDEASPTEEVSQETEEQAPARTGGLISKMKGVKVTKPPKPAASSPTAKAKSKPVQRVQSPLTPRRPGVAPRRSLKDMDRRSKSTDDSGAKREPKKKGGPNIRVAAMPDAKQPTAGSGGPKEKVQKPDIALPQDAIRSISAGAGAAPLEHLTSSKSKKKKGKGTGREEGGEVLGEMPSKGRGANKKGKTGASAGQIMGLRRRRPNNRPGRSPSPYRRRSRSGPVANTAAPRKDKVVLQLPCTVREFSEAAGVPAVQVVLTCKQLGDETNRNINSNLEDEFVEMLTEHFNVEIEIREEQTLEDSVVSEFEEIEEDPDKLVTRPPIVTFLGHVDHGKTSLLDALIGIDVVSGEAGGITQHIRAYQITKGEQKIAFVDTPGHEAFTEMRARGANVTDIAVLVVAADDGIMPQTEEAISHAKAAGVPIIVALNKIDLPGVTPDKALQDLATAELLPSEWGGETEVIKTSAIAGTGLDELLETILVTAELHEYKANPDRAAYGTCLEAEQQSDRGVVAKIMVQSGTLNVGDIVVCGGAFGKVKAMHDTLRPKNKLKHATPSTPVNLTGLDEAPGAGDKFYVVDSIAKAREIADTRKHRGKVAQVGGRSVETTLDQFQKLLEDGSLARNTEDMVTLNLIIRADVKGSIEAIQKELGKISHPEVQIKTLQALAGGVSVGDVRLAHASSAVIVAFNVVANEEARSLADELGVEIRRYEVIYKITDDLKATLEGRLKPEEQVVELGMAMVLRTFNISKSGTIAGCRVMRGSIARECRMRVIRDQTVIGDYAIESLKREKDDAKEVQRGMECGIKLEKFNDVKEGDTLEAYKIEEIARTL